MYYNLQFLSHLPFLLFVLLKRIKRIIVKICPWMLFMPNNFHSPFLSFLSSLMFLALIPITVMNFLFYFDHWTFIKLLMYSMLIKNNCDTSNHNRTSIDPHFSHQSTNLVLASLSFSFFSLSLLAHLPHQNYTLDWRFIFHPVSLINCQLNHI